MGQTRLRRLRRRHSRISFDSRLGRTRNGFGLGVTLLIEGPGRCTFIPSFRSLSSGQLAKIYGFTDLDGSQPDAWRYVIEVQDAGKPADTTGYR